jgi:putative transposase
MELEVESLTGAAHGERSADRIDHRNTYRDRDRETSAGTVEPRMPELRKGSHFRRLHTRHGREGARCDGPGGLV